MRKCSAGCRDTAAKIEGCGQEVRGRIWREVNKREEDEGG